MAAPTVIYSTDSGAPVLTGSEGSLIALFDATLVALAGWEKLFSGTGKAVYRPPYGDRQLYRIDNSANNGVGTMYSVVKCYESMSDIDTGSGLWHTGYIQNASAANTNPVDYIMIFDGYGFYIATQTTYSSFSASRYQICYYGDYVPVIDAYAWRSLACDKRWQSSNNERFFSCLFNTASSWDQTKLNNSMHRKPSGDASTLGYQFGVRSNASLVLGTETSYTRAAGCSNISATYNYPYLNSLVCAGLVVVDTDVNPIGLLPGAYHPMHPNLSTLQTIVDGGKNFLNIPICVGSDPYYSANTHMRGSVLIDIGEGFRP